MNKLKVWFKRFFSFLGWLLGLDGFGQAIATKVLAAAAGAIALVVIGMNWLAVDVVVPRWFLLLTGAAFLLMTVVVVVRLLTPDAEVESCEEVVFNVLWRYRNDHGRAWNLEPFCKECDRRVKWATEASGYSGWCCPNCSFQNLDVLPVDQAIEVVREEIELRIRQRERERA